jgi:hypothetical protein
MIIRFRVHQFILYSVRIELYSFQKPWRVGEGARRCTVLLFFDLILRSPSVCFIQMQQHLACIHATLAWDGRLLRITSECKLRATCAICHLCTTHCPGNHGVAANEDDDVKSFHALVDTGAPIEVHGPVPFPPPPAVQRAPAAVEEEEEEDEEDEDDEDGPYVPAIDRGYIVPPDEERICHVCESTTDYDAQCTSCGREICPNCTKICTFCGDYICTAPICSPMPKVCKVCVSGPETVDWHERGVLPPAYAARTAADAAAVRA